MGYEYLIAGLPELHAGDKAPMTVEQLEEQLAEQLTDSDREQLRLMKCRASYGTCAFIRDWQAFNRDLNNILTAEICRKHGFDARKYIIGEMPTDIDSTVKALSQIPNLYERERQIDAVRFAWIEDRTAMVSFSLENVLAYYLELQMLCRWDVLTRETGERIFRDIVADMKHGINGKL
ncbi:MAG: DUF2764 domain-containing protein [Paludibacteraceae bacterium]|nr:DUF2764 domain-containing protein [Paludibacteraceae bacterium]